MVLCMSMTEIQQAVSELPVNLRGDLAAWLLDSLPPHGGEDATAEGIQEAVRRRDELATGKVHPIKSADFWASIERERAQWK
jgi:Putative addiction module component